MSPAKAIINERRSSWHLDKSFSIGIIIAILFQCACFIWAGAQLASKLQTHDEKISELVLWKNKEDDSKAKIDSHLAVADEKLDEQARILTRMDERLEKLLNQKSGR